MKSQLHSQGCQHQRAEGTRSKTTVRMLDCNVRGEGAREWEGKRGLVCGKKVVGACGSLWELVESMQGSARKRRQDLPVEGSDDSLVFTGPVNLVG